LFSISDREKHDNQDAHTHEEAGEISECKGDGILVEFSTRGEQPDSGGPENHERNDQPKVAGMAVEFDDVLAADVVGEDDDGSEGAGSAEGAHLLDVGHEVSAAVLELVSREANLFKLGEALHNCEREEQENRETR